jgi:hypothetical protein
MNMISHKADRWWEDEDLLLAALDKALHPAEAVPDSFVHAAYACYTWHAIDGELAALAYDSAVDMTELAHIRSAAESAPLRALTYEASDFTFELEVTPDGLAGQLIPAQAAELQLQLTDGRTTGIETGKNGYFRIRPAPTQPFRLRCRLPDGRTVSTDIITL